MSTASREPSRALVVLGLLLVVTARASQGQARDLEATYRRGAESLQRGDLPRALETLESIAAADAGYRDVQILLGQVCLALGLEDAAKEHIDQALAQDPSSGYAAFLQGFVLYQASRYHEAVGALDRAHALAPENPNPLVYRGLAQLRQGRPSQAAADLEAALALAPDDATALTGVAELELARGEAAAAEERLRGVLARSPESVDARFLLARTLFESNRPAAAVPILEALVEELPHRSDALHLLAQSLLRSGHEDDGRRALDRFRSLKEGEERMKVIEVILKGAPEDLGARLELIDLYLDGGHPGGALPHLATLRRLLDPADPRLAAIATRVEHAFAARR